MATVLSSRTVSGETERQTERQTETERALDALTHARRRASKPCHLRVCALVRLDMWCADAYNLSNVNAAQIEAGGPDLGSLEALRYAAANDKLVQFHIEFGYPPPAPPP